MTPQQVHAWVRLGHDREATERAIRLSDMTSAARGEPREVDRMVKELTHGR